MDLASSFDALRELCKEHPDNQELAEQRVALGRELLETQGGGIDLTLEAASLWFSQEPALCHEAFWRRMADRPSGPDSFFADMFLEYARLARGHELPSSVLPWVARARRDRRLRHFVDQLTLGLPPGDEPAPPSDLDAVLEVGTDGGLFCAGDCERTEQFLDGELDLDEAARLQVLPWFTDGDGVFSIRVRAGSVRTPRAAIELVTDELCIRGIGGQATLDVVRGCFAATIKRGKETNLELVLQRVPRPIRWSYGDSMPDPLALTAAERRLLLGEPPK